MAKFLWLLFAVSAFGQIGSPGANNSVSGGTLLSLTGTKNVLIDCGVKFDGATDDTGAWNACLADNVKIWIPSTVAACSLISHPIGAPLTGPYGYTGIVIYSLFTQVGTSLPCIRWIAPLSTISSITCSANVLTVTTTTPHSWVAREAIEISGNATSGFNTPTTSADNDDVVQTVPSSTTFTVNRTCVNGTGAGGAVSGGTMIAAQSWNNSRLEGVQLDMCNVAQTNCAHVGVEADGLGGDRYILTNNRFNNITAATTIPNGYGETAYRVHRQGSTNGEMQIFDNDFINCNFNQGSHAPTELNAGIGFEVYNATNIRNFEVAHPTAINCGVGVWLGGENASVHDSSNFSQNYTDVVGEGGRINNINGEFEVLPLDMAPYGNAQTGAGAGVLDISNTQFGCDFCNDAILRVYGGTKTVISVHGNSWTYAIKPFDFSVLTSQGASTNLFAFSNTWGIDTCPYTTIGANYVTVLELGNTTNPSGLSCNSTLTGIYATSGNVLGKGLRIVQGSGTLSTGSLSVTITNNASGASFTSASSYQCLVDDTSTPANRAYVSTYTSGTAFTITGTGTDAVRFTCSGN